MAPRKSAPYSSLWRSADELRGGKGLDSRSSRAQGDDRFGDLDEYLLRHVATESGQSTGRFWTPAEESRDRRFSKQRTAQRDMIQQFLVGLAGRTALPMATAS